ncbi:hypothetical protein [Streptomyces sp. NPDC054794]
MYVISARLLHSHAETPPGDLCLIDDLLRAEALRPGSRLEHHWMRPDPAGCALVLYVRAPSLEAAEYAGGLLLRRAVVEPGLACWSVDQYAVDLPVDLVERFLLDTTAGDSDG